MQWEQGSVSLTLSFLTIALADIAKKWGSSQCSDAPLVLAKITNSAFRQLDQICYLKLETFQGKVTSQVRISVKIVALL